MASSDALPLDGPVAAFDLEWTAWEGSQARDWSGPGEEREIVEIGAVRLDGDDGLCETARFQRLVRPRINPRLSDYFIRLTGITQEMVDEDGIPFEEAFADFMSFLDGPPPVRAVYSFGQDPLVLKRNCDLTGIGFPAPDALFHNTRPPITALTGRPDGSFASSDLPAILGFAPPMDAHRALGDARCVAKGLRRLRRVER